MPNAKMATLDMDLPCCEEYKYKSQRRVCTGFSATSESSFADAGCIRMNPDHFVNVETLTTGIGPTICGL